MAGDPGATLAAGGAACVADEVAAQRALPSLQLLIDTSGSMNLDAPGRRGSRWAATRQALIDAIDGLTSDVSLGVIFYPQVPASTQPCFERQTAVVLAPLGGTGSVQRQQIVTALAQESPEGGTPTHDAYRYALESVTGTAPGSSRFIVLLTDGTPTYSLGCVGTGVTQDAVDTSPLIAEAQNALSNGIRTFVVGSPGSEDARQSLSLMAEAGGTALAGCSPVGPNYCHFDMTQESDLGAGLTGALAAITGSASRCYYAIPQPPSGAALDLGKLNVRFAPLGADEELVAKSAGQDCSEGWQYSGNQVQLCGSTCDRVRASEGVVSLEFGCATQSR